MTRFYRRRPPERRETTGAALVAAGLALGVAAVSFYLVRTFLSREALEPLTKPGEREGGAPAGEGAGEDAE